MHRHGSADDAHSSPSAASKARAAATAFPTPRTSPLSAHSLQPSLESRHAGRGISCSPRVGKASLTADYFTRTRLLASFYGGRGEVGDEKAPARRVPAGATPLLPAAPSPPAHLPGLLLFQQALRPRQGLAAGCERAGRVGPAKLLGVDPLDGGPADRKQEGSSGGVGMGDWRGEAGVWRRGAGMRCMYVRRLASSACRTFLPSPLLPLCSLEHGAACEGHGARSETAGVHGSQRAGRQAAALAHPPPPQPRPAPRPPPPRRPAAPPAPPPRPPARPPGLQQLTDRQFIRVTCVHAPLVLPHAAHLRVPKQKRVALQRGEPLARQAMMRQGGAVLRSCSTAARTCQSTCWRHPASTGPPNLPPSLPLQITVAVAPNLPCAPALPPRPWHTLKTPRPPPASACPASGSAGTPSPRPPLRLRRMACGRRGGAVRQHTYVAGCDVIVSDARP